MYGPQSKWCFVPRCTSTSATTPDKIFVRVPKDPERKQKWFKAAKRDMPKSKSEFFCCEDHFNLEEDMENYVRFKLVGGPITMKRDVVPHFFECHSDHRKRVASNVSTSTGTAKRERKRLVTEAEIYAFEPLSVPLKSSDSTQKHTPQVVIGKSYKSIGVQVRPLVHSEYVQCNLEDTNELQSSSFAPSTSAASADVEIPTVTCNLLEEHARFYMGVPNNWLPHFIRLLCEQSDLKKEDIYLTLLKIKLNDPFEVIADMFGMTTKNISKLFTKSLFEIEPFFNRLIFCPPVERIVYFQSIPFRGHYNKVHFIINCIEIEIESSKDSINQSFMWSEYKDCDTLKYLVSSTADGFINFVSKGYGGAISDSLLLQSCGFLEHLPTGSAVLANGGFEDIAKCLNERRCFLVQPPSISSARKTSKAVIIENKLVVKLQMHIQRVIRRIREFQFLRCHSGISSSLIRQADTAVKVACGLINLQSSIIGQSSF